MTGKANRRGANGRQTTETSPGSKAVDVPWLIHFFQRHPDDDRRETVPAREFLLACPDKVRQVMLAVVKAVADAPPPAFSGGGKWEAMHGEMSGFYEVRVDGPKRHHYRLFCVLEQEDGTLGLGGPSDVMIAGKDKPFQTVLSPRDYDEVRRLREEYRGRKPRSILR